MKNQLLKILQSRLKRMREIQPQLDPDFRMDPKEALKIELETSLILAREERNPREIREFEEALKILETM